VEVIDYAWSVDRRALTQGRLAYSSTTSYSCHRSLSKPNGKSMRWILNICNALFNTSYPLPQVLIHQFNIYLIKYITPAGVWAVLFTAPMSYKINPQAHWICIATNRCVRCYIKLRALRRRWKFTIELINHWRARTTSRTRGGWLISIWNVYNWEVDSESLDCAAFIGVESPHNKLRINLLPLICNFRIYIKLDI